MTKKRKILNKIVNGSKNVRFEEFVTLLQALGFDLRRISGSHHVIKHPEVADVLSVQPDKNGQVKGYQARQLLEMIETHNLTLDEEEED